MAKYIFRLDDACPNMNHENWNIIEDLFCENDILPIVGVIPDSKDEKFSWEEDLKFWDKVKRWENMGWTIAMHGCHHKLHDYCGAETYCKTTYPSSEFAGVSYDEQLNLLLKAYNIFKTHDVNPQCFFAPGHTFDNNTVRALKNVGKGDIFISDGCDFFPFTDLGVAFLPTMFDTPVNIDFLPGCYTFVFHPSFMTSEGIKRLSKFIKKHRNRIISASDVQFTERKRGKFGKICENIIFIIRRSRNKK